MLRRGGGVGDMVVNTGVPCRDCEKRQVGCHGKCEAYQHYAAGREAIREEKARKNEAEGYTRNCIRARKIKVLREQQRGRHTGR